MEGIAVVPDSAMEPVKRALMNLKELKPQLVEFLSLAEPEVLALLPPLQRAKSMFLLAEATTTLFALRLRCTGVHPDDHRIKTELNRVSRYRGKLERLVDWSKAPLRPTATLNRQAATHFIGHSLPDLTPAQRESMRDISKTSGHGIKYSERSVHKKRKFQSPQAQSVQIAAKEFLEKATRELLGDNENGLKGPLRVDASEVADLEMD